MKKMFFAAVAAAAVSTTAFAETNRMQWYFTGGIPGQFCSPGVYQGAICTEQPGYQCRGAGTQLWSCDYFNGAVRARFIGNIPNRYCNYNEYQGAGCNSNGARCVDQNSAILVCGW